MTPMSESERWELLGQLDEEILKGGVTLSEWCTFITGQSDIAFAGGAFLASILTAVSGIETYLRAGHSFTGKCRLVDLIEKSPIHQNLKEDIQILRKYRNKWVHVDDPWDDERLLERPEEAEMEIEKMAIFAARVLRRTIYENQWI